MSYFLKLFLLSKNLSLDIRPWKFNITLLIYYQNNTIYNNNKLYIIIIKIVHEVSCMC